MDIRSRLYLIKWACKHALTVPGAILNGLLQLREPLMLGNPPSIPVSRLFGLQMAWCVAKHMPMRFGYALLPVGVSSRLWSFGKGAV